MATRARSIEERIADLEREVAALKAAAQPLEIATGFGEEGQPALARDTAAIADLEQRIARLEADVAELKAAHAPSNKADVEAWRRIMGRFKDDPYYEKAMRTGRAWRRRENKC